MLIRSQAFQKSAPWGLIKSQHVFNCGKRRSSSFLAILSQNCKMHTKWVKKKVFWQINSWCLQGLKKFLKHFHYSKLIIERVFRIIAMRERNFHDRTTHQCIFNCTNVPYCSFWVFTITQTTEKLRIAYFCSKKKHIWTPLRKVVVIHWYNCKYSKYVESITRG